MSRILNINILARDTKRAKETLRRNIRRAITGGNNIYAIVLGVYLNMATVQVEHTNQKMYGLSITGGDVSVGDRVILDYSHGPPPFVRSNYTTADDKPETELGIYNDGYVPESTPTTDGEGWWVDKSLEYKFYNLSAGLYLNDYGEGQDLVSGTPTTLMWASNNLVQEWYVILWQTSNDIWPGKEEVAGGSTLYCPMKGRYLINVGILMSGDSYGLWHPWTSGWARLRIIQGGTTPIAETTARIGRTPNGQWQEAHMFCNAIASMEYGQSIHVEITQTYSGNENTALVFGGYYERAHISIVSLPGTIYWIA